MWLPVPPQTPLQDTTIQQRLKPLEQFWLEGWDYLSRLSNATPTFHYIRMLRALCSPALKVPRDEASPHLWANLCQCFTTLTAKFFLASVSTLNWHSWSLKPLSFVPPQQDLLKSLSLLFKYWKTAIRSPQRLLLPRLNSLNYLSLSSQLRCPLSFIIFVALWTHSSRSSHAEEPGCITSGCAPRLCDTC